MNRQNSPVAVIFGIILVVVGGLFLVSSFNWLSIDVGMLIGRYWPALLIVVGLYVIVRNPLVTLILTVLMVGVIAVVEDRYVPAERSLRNEAGNRSERRELHERYDASEVQRWDLTIEMGAANIRLGALNENDSRDTLLEGTARTAEPLQLEREHDGQTEKVTLKADEGSQFLFNAFKRELELDLSRALPLSLAIDSGASNINIDAERLLLENFFIDSGASNITMTIGDRSTMVRGTIDSGATAITVRVPRELGIKITADLGLSGNNFEDEGLRKNGDTYTTEGYDAAAKKIELKVDAGASNIKLQRR